MRPFVYATLLHSLLGASVLAAVPLSSIKRDGSKSAGGIIPNKFIVEVENLANIPSLDKREYKRVSGAPIPVAPSSSYSTFSSPLISSTMAFVSAQSPSVSTRSTSLDFSPELP